MAKTISICIPSYNCERYVRTTIESALAQTVAADEILISDDRSPDGSWAIVQEYEGVARVRVMRPPERMTLGQHYRFLLEQATSDYICFLSSDDALMPNFIETMQQELAGEENVGLIAGACLEATSTLVPLKLRGTRASERPLDPPESFRYMAAGCVYTISFSLLSRRILMEAPVVPREGDLATDWCWGLLLCARGRVKFVRQPMGFYRVHTTNAGHQNEDRWQVACEVMLRFVMESLGPPLSEELRPAFEQLRGELAKRQAGEIPVAVAERRSRKQKLEDMVKWALAQRYRRLPPTIVKAEQGVGVALLAARGRS